MFYAIKVQTADKHFVKIDVMGRKHLRYYATSIPGTVILCNGCNKNVYPEAGYLLYLNKQDLAADYSYGFYCKGCLEKYFKEYEEV